MSEVAVERLDGSLSDYIDIAYAVQKAAIPPKVEGRVRPLRRLTVEHRRMVALHLQGYSTNEIAHSLGKHPGTVGAVLRNPTTLALLESVYEDYERELRALFPLGIKALRRGLLSESERIALTASDQLWRVHGRYKHSEEGERDASDTVQELIRLRHEASGTDITIARKG
jgi:hypothetical protein